MAIYGNLAAPIRAVISTAALLFAILAIAPKHANEAWAGSARIGGRIMTCPRAEVIFSNELPGVGYAAPGRIALNRRLLRKYPRAVRRMIFLHECAHQYVGANETAADCWAVRRARRQGWLTRRGLKQVCASFKGSTGGTHLPGPARCRAMMRCYRRR